MRHIGRRWWLILLVTLLSGYGLFKISEADCFTLAGDVLCRVETSEKVVALSLDDGPTTAGVDHATGVLARYGVKATFFLIGHEMERRPEAGRRLHDAGHELGNHSYSHFRMVARTGAFYDREIAHTGALLRRAGHKAPTLFRPPYGKKLIGLPLAIERQGYRMIMWDVAEPRDAGDDHRAVAEHIVRSARPGSIIIMHVMYPANETARRALPLVLEGLQARGFRIVPVGELIAGRTRSAARPI